MIPSEVKFLLDSDDIKIMTLAEQIYSDYLDILKRVVLPHINKDHKFRMRELRVLMCLRNSTVSVSAMDLAEHLRQDPATITRSIVSLIRGGYAITEENRSDGRSKIIALTAKGKAASIECRQLLEKFFQDIKASEEYENLPHLERRHLFHFEDSSRRARSMLTMAKKK